MSVTSKRPLSMPFKAGAATACVLVIMGTGQYFGLSWLLRTAMPDAWSTGIAAAERSPDVAARLWWGLVAIVLVPYAIAVLIAWIYTRETVRLRAARIVSVLDRIARGELEGELLASIDSDLIVVRDALSTMQHALSDLTSRLKHTDEQRRRLFADLFHELATPLSSILAIAEALADPLVCRTEADRRRVVTHLEEEATRLEHLVGDVRELAYLDDPDVALTPAPIEVGSLAARAVERIKTASKNRVAIRCDAVAIEAVVDGNRIEQVIVNLLNNAERHTPDGGSIDVRVEAAAGPAVRIVVEDSGGGVPDEMLPRLGERLLRIDPSRDRRTGGHGLGLSIVSAIVHRHGGTLSFGRSRLGGLRADVMIPLQRDEEPPHAGTPAAGSDGRPPGRATPGSEPAIAREASRVAHD